MDYNKIIHDRVDSYLLNEMNSEDKAQFEQDLLSDPALKKEYEFQLSLQAAARENAEEASFISELKKYRANAGSKKSFWSKLREWMFTPREVSFTLPEFSSDAEYNGQTGTVVLRPSASFQAVLAVASVALLFFIGSPITSSHYSGLNAPYFTESLQVSTLKGDDELWDMDSNIKGLLKDGKYDEAYDMVIELREKIRSLAELYDEEEIKTLSDNADWYEALSLMGQHKSRKARKILQKIASGGGDYAVDAEEALKSISIFHWKKLK